MTNRRPPPTPRWLTIIVVVALVSVTLWQQRHNPPEPQGQDAAGTSPTSVAEPSESPRRSKPSEASNAPSATPTSRESPTRQLGELREIRKGVFESTAGLIYKPGGQEGHRIDHVLQHAVDNPAKPVHGVFRGDRNEILAVIDEAYELSRKRGPPVTMSEQDGDRTAYTVDLGRDIGYGGGQSGARKKKPPLTHLKLVLDGKDVITAYPTER